MTVFPELPMDMEMLKRRIRGADEDLLRAMQFGFAGECVVCRTQAQALAYPQQLWCLVQDLDIQPARQKLRIAGYVSRKVEQLLAGPG